MCKIVGMVTLSFAGERPLASTLPIKHYLHPSHMHPHLTLLPAPYSKAIENLNPRPQFDCWHWCYLAALFHEWIRAKYVINGNYENLKV